MSHNNLKALSKSEMKYLNGRYSFELEGSQVLVRINNYNRVTAHSVNERFSLNTKVRKIDITPEAIRMWKNKFMHKYTLLDVQNAINTLISTYQMPDIVDVESQLKRGTAEIETI